MAMRFTLRQIEYFVAVGELGSIALAAERLHISSPWISTAISQLEATFGLQLFIRQHAQGLALTPAGRRFLAEAKTLLAQAQTLHGVAGKISGEVRGAITVGSLVTLAPVVLPKLRRSFEAAHPEAELHQFTSHQVALLEALRAARVDIALTYDLEIPQDIAFEPLAALPPVALLAPDHPLVGAEVTLEKLADEKLILLDLPLSREYFLSLFHQAGLRPRIAERVPEMSMIRSMVANGFGYSLANMRPSSVAAPDGERLRTVPLGGGHRPLMLGLATVRMRFRPRILEAFEEHCRAAITDSDIPGMTPVT
ncbi:MAG TPA: LysR substrate-binding domain-containing protein [Thermohalobaculum sp.]|nr:LysR substrate-binding domain-containing protein [Thermohalobaculum sp.]